MAGTKNDVLVGKNADFSQAGAPNGSSGEANGLITDAQLWVGSTATNAGGTHVNVGTVTSPDSSITFGYSSPNITAVVAGGTTSVTTLTPNEDFDGTAATPVAPQNGTINVLGSNPSFATVTETYNSTGASTGNFLVEHRAWTTGLVVDTSTTPGTRGTYATLAAAMAAAVSGQTIFLRTSVTENVTITPGVNISAWAGQSNTVAIIGNTTMTAAGTSTISGVRLQTNGAACVTVSGSAASILNLNACYIDAADATAISFSSSSASSEIMMNNCYGNVGTTGIALFAHTSAGVLTMNHCNYRNTGGSTTANTVSSGNVTLRWTRITNPLTSSSTASIGIFESIINTGAQNTTSLTVGGSGANLINTGHFLSGTATAVVVTSTLTISLSTIDCSNAAAISGAGNLVNAGIDFSGTSSNITVTTQSLRAFGGAQFLGKNVGGAPSAGMIGETISSTVAVGSAISLPSATPTNVTSISLTNGSWVISGTVNLRGTLTGTAFSAGIATTSASFSGVQSGYNGSNTPTLSTATADSSLVIPHYIRNHSATTTIYLLASATYTVGTGTVYGSILATRVA